MTKLPAKELESLDANDAGRVLREDGGLSGKVQLKKKCITVAFYYQFRWEGRFTDISCGTWPGTSLPEIRKIRNIARDLVATGVTPNDHKRAEKARIRAEVNAQLVAAETLKAKGLTLGDMAEKWLLNGVARKDGNAEMRRRFTKDLYPTLKNKTLSSV